MQLWLKWGIRPLSCPALAKRKFHAKDFSQKGGCVHALFSDEGVFGVKSHKPVVTARPPTIRLVKHRFLCEYEYWYLMARKHNLWCILNFTKEILRSKTQRIYFQCIPKVNNDFNWSLSFHNSSDRPKQTLDSIEIWSVEMVPLTFITCLMKQENVPIHTEPN